MVVFNFSIECEQGVNNIICGFKSAHVKNSALIMKYDCLLFLKEILCFSYSLCCLR